MLCTFLYCFSHSVTILHLEHVSGFCITPSQVLLGYRSAYKLKLEFCIFQDAVEGKSRSSNSSCLRQWEHLFSYVSQEFGCALGRAGSAIHDSIKNETSSCSFILTFSTWVSLLPPLQDGIQEQNDSPCFLVCVQKER